MPSPSIPAAPSDLEGIYGELGDLDISTSLTTFFNSIQNIATQPENLANRQIAVANGDSLARDINRLASRAGEICASLNDRVERAADDINRLVEEIRVLNLRIGEAEATDVSDSDAVGLRDQRHIALTNLAKLIDIEVHEQTDRHGLGLQRRRVSGDGRRRPQCESRGVSDRGLDGV